MLNLNTSEPHYSLTLASSEQHLMRVQLHAPKPDPLGQIFYLPAWIPGSYMIRDFAKNLISLQAQDAQGATLTLKKLDKQSWQLTPHNGPVTLTYEIYAFDLSVRSAFFDREFAFFNGTSAFLGIKGQEHLPVTLDINPPTEDQNWQLGTTLPTTNGTEKGQFGQYLAKNYAHLIDCPVLAGDMITISFSAEGVTFELILTGTGALPLDVARLKRDLSKICAHHLQLFGTPSPVSHYQFLTMVTDNGFGGLEHLDSTALMCSRDDLPILHQDEISDGYRTFLSLCSHELFHTWHVKRIQPARLKQADLQQEQYTEQLWIYEGFTSYYDDLTLSRCGVISQESYLELLGQQLTRLHRNHGRLQQTVTESSWYTWNKFYKQDENAINGIVSYYNKGAIIALCLDMMLRHNTGQIRNLDHVMGYLWREYGLKQIGTEPDCIHQYLTKHHQEHMITFLNQALYTTEELPFETLLENQGITVHYRARSGASDKGGKSSSTSLKNQFGAAFKARETGIEITQVSHHTPASQAGLSKGDLLLAIDEHQVSASNIHTLLDRYAQGVTLPMAILRRGLLHHLTLAISPAIKDTLWLEITDQGKADQWLTLGNQ